jgi:hypothetical protein
VPNTLYSRVVGALLPPPRYFFKLVDILHEAEPNSPALLSPLDQESPGKGADSE